jgi:hypothetical protein
MIDVLCQSIIRQGVINGDALIVIWRNLQNVGGFVPYYEVQTEHTKLLQAKAGGKL